MSQKSERLVNLTIALLATKRYLTKSEIFRTVAGYDGDQVARDRMFERDKDDLRTLGIDIEVGTFDPLFEDEPGYRIKRDKYELQLKSLTPLKLLLLSQASQMWRKEALGESAQLALRKLKSLGIESDIQGLLTEVPAVLHAPTQVGEIITALNNQQKIEFNYTATNLLQELRRVEPYRLSRTDGYWYLIARDVAKSELRTFRVDRIASSITLIGAPQSYEIDSDALNSHLLSTKSSLFAEVAILEGTSQNIRNHGRYLRDEDEWQIWEFPFFDESDLIREVLWNGESARLISPETAVSELIRKVSEMVSLHG